MVAGGHYRGEAAIIVTTAAITGGMVLTGMAIAIMAAVMCITAAGIAIMAAAAAIMAAAAGPCAHCAPLKTLRSSGLSVNPS